MKIIISLIIGAAIVWGYLTTVGKKYITETVVVIETNWVTQTETRYFDQTRWTTQTNVVWITNIVEKTIVRETPDAPATLGIIYSSPQPSTSKQPTTFSPPPQQQLSPNVPQVQPMPTKSQPLQKSGFQGPKPAGKVKSVPEGQPTKIKLKR